MEYQVSSERILSACSLTSGSILAYIFADFAATMHLSFQNYICFLTVILQAFVTTIAIQIQDVFAKLYLLSHMKQAICLTELQELFSVWLYI